METKVEIVEKQSQEEGKKCRWFQIMILVREEEHGSCEGHKPIAPKEDRVCLLLQPRNGCKIQRKNHHTFPQATGCEAIKSALGWNLLHFSLHQCWDKLSQALQTSFMERTSLVGEKGSLMPTRSPRNPMDDSLVCVNSAGAFHQITWKYSWGDRFLA